MLGLKRQLELLREGPDAPVSIVAKQIGNRWMRTGKAENVLGSALQQYNSRVQQHLYSRQIIRVLNAYSQCSEESQCQYHLQLLSYGVCSGNFRKR